MVGASGFEPPASWSRTINPRNIKDLAEAQRFCAALRYVASLQRLAGLPRGGTGCGGQRFYAWGGHKNGHSFSERVAALWSDISDSRHRPSPPPSRAILLLKIPYKVIRRKGKP
jgi:hypothetical protein